jgi:hypothetical protein
VYKILIAVVLALSWSAPSHSVTLCPDGSYVGGRECQLAPDGSYVSGDRYPQLAPDGSYTGGNPRLAPDGTYVGGHGSTTLCPDGSYVSGRCELAPNGSYVGRQNAVSTCLRTWLERPDAPCDRRAGTCHRHPGSPDRRSDSRSLIGRGPPLSGLMPAGAKPRRFPTRILAPAATTL